MKAVLNRLPVALRALRELGAARTFWYAVYQAGLRGGFYRRAQTSTSRYPIGRLRSPYGIPDAGILLEITGEALPDVIADADEIRAGEVRLFGGRAVPLNLVPPETGHHWTYYEGRPETWGVQDIKTIWEPARFGWAYTLGRAYVLTRREEYPAAFWGYLETFLAANLPNQGPNWASAQEVGLRLLALLFAASAFENAASTTLARMDRLARAVADHAERIPLTLSYARAQNNNHRISEALALYIAGWALPDHPQAQRWHAAGWRELNDALNEQIEPNGTYTQHSMNYHRLMLQAALQGLLLGRPYPQAVEEKLAAATRWLLAQIDPHSGHAPNLGSNDGALIFPMAACDFADQRPTAQAAARVFLNEYAFAPGPWDETGAWLGLPALTEEPPGTPPTSPAVHRIGNAETWGTLRAVRFHGRPAHADQLHADLWWRGENIALDAGTFRYTAPPPWDNALAETRVHNTVEVNRRSQMRRAGRFLWLDWAQAELLPAPSSGYPALAAQHDGYRKDGVVHQRTLELPEPRRWRVTDLLLPARDMIHSDAFELRLHWLLPDWDWTLEESALRLERPGGGSIRLTLCAVQDGSPLPLSLSLARAGETVAGRDLYDPILGWYSSTYYEKIPALSLVAAARAALPCTITSEWLLEAEPTSL